MNANTRVHHSNNVFSLLPCHLLLVSWLLSYSYRVQSAILRTGNPLAWTAAKPYLTHVRTSGYQQFSNHYKRCLDLETPLFLWGDELEYGLFKYIPDRNRYDLSYSGTKLREQLNRKEKSLIYSGLPIGCEWQPEYGSWMIEAVPRNPYGSYLSDLINVEKSMQLRRTRLHKALSEGEIAPSMSTFPMLGVEGYPHQKDRLEHKPKLTNSTDSKVADSLYVSDDVINPHVRFGTLTRNIRQRRGSNVNITIPADRSDEPIHMDAMAFGMGCCCLQVTMQCKSEKQSRYLHDQLAILCPILQALSASSPIFKGMLAATDTRWEVIAQAVDDRTPAESNLWKSDNATTLEQFVDEQLVGQGIRQLQKSRYSSVAMLIGQPEDSEQLENIQALNDLPVDVDEKALAELTESGLDPVLATHIAHLFIRDPLVIFDDAIELDNMNHMDHFENIQSTNWRSMRWKLPSLRIGMEYERRKKQTELDSKFKSSTSMKSQEEFPVLDDREAVESLDRNILLEDRYAFAELEGIDESQMDEEKMFFLQGQGIIPTGDTTTNTPVQEEKLNPHSLSTPLPDCNTQDLQAYGPGWRVEFRPLEVQATDFENAAYAILVVLLARTLISTNNEKGFNLYMPMSYVEENMRRAQMKDAVGTQKFWIRRPSQNEAEKVVGNNDDEEKEDDDDDDDDDAGCCDLDDSVRKKEQYDIPSPKDVEVVELSMDEIINGERPNIGTNSTNLFPGLLPLVHDYLDLVGCHYTDQNDVASALSPYLRLIEDRASGKLPTTAQWMREFVENHPEFIGENKDIGRITPKIADDLLCRMDDIGMGRIQCPELYGDFKAPLDLDEVDEDQLMFQNLSCYPRPKSKFMVGAAANATVYKSSLQI